MIIIRRLPGIVLTHKYKFIFLICLLAFCLSSLYSWGIICSNFEAWDRLASMCSLYRKNQISGDLCPKLCENDFVQFVSCQTYHAGKETVFSVTMKDHETIMVKSSQSFEPQEIFYWVDDFGEHYPTEDIFQSMVENRIKMRLNMTLPNDQLERLLRYPSGDKLPINSPSRQREMREIWRLLQDNEYLLSIVYADKEIFSKVVGTCGHYFGVEYLKPAIDSEMMKMLMQESSENWSNRVHLAVSILDLVEQIDSENLALCDVKPNHFGISDSGKLKIVCEKILLGWAMPGVIMVPGLLMSSSTPSTLASLLRQCAHGAGNSEFDAHVASRLTITLSKIDEQLQGFS